MKILLPPSFLVVLMAVWFANPVAAQQPARGAIPFVTEAIPASAPSGAVIQLRVQFNGEPESLVKYRLEIGGVTARFFLLDNRTPIVSAVVPNDINVTSPEGGGRVPIVFFDASDLQGFQYTQFSVIPPSAVVDTNNIQIVSVNVNGRYYDITFNKSIPTFLWGSVKIYINSKLAEIVKMEERVFTVTLPDAVSPYRFQVAVAIRGAETAVFNYDPYGTPTPTPTPLTESSGSYFGTVAIILVVLIGLGASIYYFFRARSKLSAQPGTSSVLDSREVLHLPPEIPPDLVRACEAGECVLYAGAGLSAECELPTWTPFVHGLLDWALENNFINKEEADEYHDEVNRGQADPVSDSLVSRLTTHEDRAALNDYLRSVFLKRTSPSALHERLQKIKFSAVLTTNFDNLLESVFKAEQTYTPKDSESLLAALTRRAFFVLKLYGKLDQPDTVLVAPAQYNSAIRDNTLFSEFMQTLFFSRTILFIGASLEGIEAYLQGIALPNAVPREHYALVAVSDNAWRAKADLLQRRYGIKVLPFTPTNDFSELKEFVDKLVEKVVIDEPGSVARGPHVSKLKRITLKNIGPFESLALDLELDAKEKWHVFLGDNGVGKSTVLKAVALALCGKDAQPYAGRLLRYDSSEDAGQTPGTITLETDNKTSYVTTIRRNDRTGQVELTSNTARPLEAEGWLAIGFPPLRTTSWEVAPKGPEAEIKTTSRNWNPVQPLSPALRDTLIAELNQLIGGQSLYDRKRFRGVQWQEKPKEREVLMKSLVKEVEAGISQKWDWVTDLTSFNRLLLEEIYPGEIPRSLKAE